MKKIYNKRGKLKEVRLDRFEQLELMRKNNALLKQQQLDVITKLSQELGMYD